jgi:hypothetical protein
MFSASWYVGSTTRARTAEAYDLRVPDPEKPMPLPARGPTALPTVKARAVAFLTIVVGGICGLLIGIALVQLQCEGSCSTPIGLGALVGGVAGAAGVAVVAVLVLRAMGEWRAGPGVHRR